MLTKGLCDRLRDIAYHTKNTYETETIIEAATALTSLGADNKRYERVLRALADFAYTFKAYPQGLAGQDPLLGVKGEDVTNLRALAQEARTLLAEEKP